MQQPGTWSNWNFEPRRWASVRGSQSELEVLKCDLGLQIAIDILKAERELNGW